jgi:hypothetical protein
MRRLPDFEPFPNHLIDDMHKAFDKLRCRRGNPGDMVRFMSQVRGGDFSGSPSRRGPSCGYSVGPFHFN